MRTAAAFVAFALVLGCSKNIDTREAVRDGVIRDISKNFDVNQMDVTVQSVQFEGAKADAVVRFTPKGGDTANGMSMRYVMARDGDRWTIKERYAAGVPGGGSMSTGTAPAMPQGTVPQGGTLPAGHPPVAGSEKP